MSDTTHDSAHAAPAHGLDDHGSGHGDGHGDALGPIDWKAWLAGCVGVLAGLVVVVALIARTA